MNPMIDTVYSADPSAHVWDDKNTLWIYASNDEPGTNTHDTMQSYHVFSTENMVEWTDWGCVLSLEDVDWAISNMWAIDAAYRNGKYYLIFCAIEAKTGMYRTGVAVSDHPQGPFTDMGFIPEVEWGQDPALFVDDDNTPYLFWGSCNSCHACQLTDDLMHMVEGTYVNLTKQLTWVFEGPFVHKYNGLYYLTYPGLFEKKWPERMYYATAEKPLGPYTFRGEYIPLFEGHSGTNHGSVAEFKGQWYAFHHSAWMSGISESRSLMCDYVTYDENGNILPIYPNKDGVSCIDDPSRTRSKVTIWLDAAGAPKMHGKLSGTTVGKEIEGYTGNGYVENFALPQYGLTVMAQASRDVVYDLKIRYLAPDGDCEKKILLNETMLCPEYCSPNEYDKLYRIPQADEWTTFTLERVTLRPGRNYIRFYNGSGEMKLDAILLEQVIE